jgi:hypothetical protein
MLGSEAGETWREIAMDFADEIFFAVLRMFL